MTHSTIVPTSFLFAPLLVRRQHLDDLGRVTCCIVSSYLIFRPERVAHSFFITSLRCLGTLPILLLLLLLGILDSTIDTPYYPFSSAEADEPRSSSFVTCSTPFRTDVSRQLVRYCFLLQSTVAIGMTSTDSARVYRCMMIYADGIGKCYGC